MDFRVTDTFLEFYQSIPDELIDAVDAVLRDILNDPGSPSSRAGRIQASSEDHHRGAWIVPLHIGSVPHNLYWLQEDEETILFVGIARTA